MCHTHVKAYTGCTAQPKHTYTREFMCGDAQNRNPPTWCQVLTPSAYGQSASCNIPCAQCTHTRYILDRNLSR